MAISASGIATRCGRKISRAALAFTGSYDGGLIVRPACAAAAFMTATGAMVAGGDGSTA